MKNKPWLSLLFAAGSAMGQEGNAQQTTPAQGKSAGATVSKADQALIQQFNAMRLLVARGDVSIGDVLDVEFNKGWPLNPSEMSQYAGDHLDSPVRLEWASLKGNLGHTNNITGNIEITNELGSSTMDYNVLLPERQNFRHLVPTAAHEAFHAAEGQGSMLLNKTAIFQPDKLIPPVNNTLERYFGRGMNRVLSMGETEEQRGLRLKKVEASYKGGRVEDSIYYFRDAERLTRMHTLMAFAYKDNGVIPKNKAEMWRVMQLANFDLPQEQLDYLQNTKEGQAAVNKFKSAKAPNGVLALNPMRDQVNALSPEQKKVYYEEVVPTDAGIVLNVLGHKNGLAAMGIRTPGVEETRKFLHEAAVSQGAATHTAAEWERMAKRVDPAYAGQAFLVLKNEYNAGAMRALLKTRGEAISTFLDDFYGPGKGKETIDYYQKYLDAGHAANESRPPRQIEPVNERNFAAGEVKAMTHDRSRQKAG